MVMRGMQSVLRMRASERSVRRQSQRGRHGETRMDQKAGMATDAKGGEFQFMERSSRRRVEGYKRENRSKRYSIKPGM